MQECSHIRRKTLVPCGTLERLRINHNPRHPVQVSPTETKSLKWHRHSISSPHRKVSKGMQFNDIKSLWLGRVSKKPAVQGCKDLRSELKREEKKNQANHSKEVKDLKANFQKTLDAKDAKIGELERESSNICRVHLTKIFGRFSWILKISRS
jgi:hypothetical protein